MKMKPVIYFVSGLASGAVTAFLAIRKHYKKQAEKEAQEARDAIMKAIDDTTEKTMRQYRQYHDIISEQEYHAPEEEITRVNDEGKPVAGRYPWGTSNQIYTIDPDEYYYDREHEKEELIYYEEEDILADGDDVVQDIESTVTAHNLTYFGQYEEGVLYVRNNNTGMDYCITKSSDHFIMPSEEPENDDDE